MSNDSHPSPTGSSSSLYGSEDNGSGVNTDSISGSPPNPSSSNNDAIVIVADNISSTNCKSPSSSQQLLNTTTCISSTSIDLLNSSTLIDSSIRSSRLPDFYEQITDDASRQYSNLIGSPSVRSLDSIHHATGVGDGFERFDSSSPTPDWSKPVTTTNSNANGWSHFQQQQQNANNPSRPNAIGSNNVSSNQWPEMNNFYGNTSSTGGSFNLPQDTNDNLTNNNSASTTWQDSPLPLSGNTSDPMTSTSNSGAGSVVNKHKSSSTSSMAASLNVALKSAIACGDANVDTSSSAAGETVTVHIPQPRLVEQLGWDEPEIKVVKRANFDDGTSIWGDPMECATVTVKKWTNGTKPALTNSTNIVLQQSQAPKPVGTGATPTSSQVGLNDENWPKQQSPTLAAQASAPWGDINSLNDQNHSASTGQKQAHYLSQQSKGSNWGSQSQSVSNNTEPDDCFGTTTIDTSDWGLQNQQSKAPFNPNEGKVDTTDWIVPGGNGGAMSGSMQMSSMSRNRYPNDYDVSEGSGEPHGVHRMGGYDSSAMNDPYRQGADLKNPIIGLGGLLPSSGNAPPSNHGMQQSQLPFNPRSGQMFPSNSILRPLNPNGIPTQSGAIMGTGGLISPKLSTTSPVPNQAPYVPLTAKQPNMPNPVSQTATSQGQQMGGAGATGMNNNGAVQAQIMQQFRLAVQAGLISQDLLNTKLPQFMLQHLQKLFELQQKYQALTMQLTDFCKHKQRFPITFFQSEQERLSKLISQKKQEMLFVQKQIQEAHTKIKQQQSTTSTPTPSQMMVNGPNSVQTQGLPPGVSSASAQDQLADRMQHSIGVDHSRLHQWTKPTLGRAGQGSSSMFPPPPGLSQKDWQSSNNNTNETWETSSTTDSSNNNPGAGIELHMHNNQGVSSVFSDQLADFVDDSDGPPPFVPGQPWAWKSPITNAEDDPHVTPSSISLAPKGPSSSMNNLNVGGSDSAFSNPQMMHMQRQQHAMRSQWQQSLHDPQMFGSSMNDWNKGQQYRAASKPSPSLNHPPPHAAFGGYRPYM